MDNINHPAHYNAGKIEVLDFIEDQKMGFSAGNVVKYVARHSHKGGVEDLKKARVYLDRMIEQYEAALEAKFNEDRAKESPEEQAKYHGGLVYKGLYGTAENSSKPHAKSDFWTKPIGGDPVFAPVGKPDSNQAERANERYVNSSGKVVDGNGIAALPLSGMGVPDTKPVFYVRKTNCVDVEEVVAETPMCYVIERPKQYSDFRSQPIREHWLKTACVVYKSRRDAAKDGFNNQP